MVSNQSNGRGTKKNEAFWPSRAQLDFLQRNCKNIESINYDSSLKSTIRPFLTSWTLLRRIPALDSLDEALLQALAPRLTTLILTRPAIIELKADNCFQLLAGLTHLDDLTLSCLVNFGISENNGPLPLNLPLLLKSCPRLQTLCLGLFKVDAAEKKGSYYQQRQEQRYPLKTLTLEMVEFGSPEDVKWLSQVTPCLSSLSLYRATVVSPSISLADLQPPTLVWATFVGQHRNTLRDLAVERIWGPDEWKTTMLTAVRPKSLMVLKTGSLDMAILPTVGSKRTGELFVDVLLNALSPLATKLEASLWPALRSVKDEFAAPLGRACRFLTDLELTGSTTPVYKDFGKKDVALDELLMQLRHLRRLRLWFVNVMARPARSTSPLEALYIFESTVCDSLFDYLSLHCPALHTVTVHRCYAYVGRAPFTTFTIRMPDTELQSLSIRSLNFLCMAHDKKSGRDRMRVMPRCSVIALKHHFGANYYYKNLRQGLNLNSKSFPGAVKVVEDATSGAGISNEMVVDEEFFCKLEREWYDLEKFHMKTYRAGFGIVMVHVKKMRHCSFEGQVVRR